MAIHDPRDVLTRPAPPPDAVLRYGPRPDQVADLRFPPSWRSGGGRSPGPAVLILLLHGGFWRAAYDRSHTGPMAAALAAENFVVCSPEFRRVGQPGGGWPGTFDDVAAAVDTLPSLVAAQAGRVAGGPVAAPREGPDLQGDLGEWRVVLAGHSAGGHLALWAASRRRLPVGSPWHLDAGGPVAFCGVVALAPVSDLGACYRDGLGRHAAGALLGGGPSERVERYAVTDPARLVPLGVPLRIVHGSDDEPVPCRMSREFAARAAAAGDDVVLTELPGRGHFDVIDPLSGAWGEVVAAFRAVAGLPAWSSARDGRACMLSWRGGSRS